ncbi:MAG TPA: glycosyltransferase family 39 protein, partial [Anaerolineae bacterium]|nr:glycosyltransferase family 39 protein [Anaerolineae bacterium]
MNLHKAPNTRFLLILLPVFGSFVLFYSLATPLFEAPDEVWHYAYVRWLAEGHGLPALDDAAASGANQEVAQPPLYYGVAALFSAPFADDDLSDLFWHNPNFGYQAPTDRPDNKNMLIHTVREAWPWRGAVLAVRMTRLASLFFGMLAVVAAYGLALETLSSPRAACWAALLVALTPQFLFISGVVSNDSAAAALATATLWALARALKRGFTVRRSLLVGALIGVAALAKVSNLALGGLAVLALLYADVSARRTTTPRLTERLDPRRFRLLKPLLALGLAALLTGGWWYARNLLLYADPLALHSHTAQPWARPEPASLALLLAELPTVYRSFWGAFGWGHVEFAPWIYWLLALLPLTSLAGWLWTLKTRRAPGNPPLLGLAAMWCALVGGAFLVWLRTLGAAHGRLLFPALGALAVLLVAGWEGLRTSEKANKRENGSADQRMSESPPTPP